MEADPEASGSGAGPSSSSPPAAGRATAAASSSMKPPPPPPPPSRYESQKRRDWNTFLQYLRNHKPPLSLSRCSGAHVIEFLKYLDQFGKTKIHVSGCAFFGHPNPPASCACPLRQAWGSLDALIGRLRAAYEENGGRPESNPFGARAVGIYLREVRASQAKARGIPYEKKKRKRPGSAAQPPADAAAGEVPTSSAAAAPAPGADTSGAANIPESSSAGAKPPPADAAKSAGAAAGSSSATAADQPSAAPEAGSTSKS